MRVFIISQKGERERDAIHEKDKLGVTEFHRQGKKDNPRGGTHRTNSHTLTSLGTKRRSLNRTRAESYVL